MLKKIALVLLLVCLSFSLFASSGNVKLRAMSLTGVADCSNYANFFVNPASLYLYNQATKFAVSTGLISNPDFYIATEFINKRIAFSVDVSIRDSLETIFRDVNLEFNAAAGYKNLGFGFGFYGGSTMYQKKSKNALAYALFGKYKRVEESEFVNMKAGVVYKLYDFTFGINADQVVRYSGSYKQLSADNILDSISFGAYWAQQQYAKRGRLKKWVFNAGIEATNIFSVEERAARIGADATLQLNKDYSISFRTGTIVALQNDVSMILSGGVGTRLGIFDVGACVLIPLTSSTSPASFEIGLSVNN